MIYNKIIELLESKNADAILIKNPHNIRYITGYRGDTGCVYISKNKKVLFTDFRYIFQAVSEAPEYEIIDIQNEGYSASVAKLADEEGIKSLLFEGNEMFYKEYTTYKEKMPDILMISIEDELSSFRMVKTEYELEQIKMAEYIGDLTFAKILDDIKPGVSELEISAKLEYYMKSNGAEDISFKPIVASGINSSMPHAIPSKKKLAAKEFITLDFGCKYNGYCSDMTRTVMIGKADNRQKDIYDTVLKAQLAVLDTVKAGMRGCDIDKIARDIIYAAGYEGCFGHGLGHSVGLNIHEIPRASEKYDKLVEENMTLTIEPGIYVKDYCGVRIEDLVVVTKNGYINYTNSPKELIEL